MDSTMDSRILKALENLSISTPVRKNENTGDDNKENILAGQDISRPKSEEKSAGASSTPVFSARDSNSSSQSIDKINDVDVNSENVSKKSESVSQTPQTVVVDVDNSEVSPDNIGENLNPFIYHCKNLEQTVLRKDNNIVSADQKPVLDSSFISEYVSDDQIAISGCETPEIPTNITISDDKLRTESFTTVRDTSQLDSVKTALFIAEESSELSPEVGCDEDSNKFQEQENLNNTYATEQNITTTLTDPVVCGESLDNVDREIENSEFQSQINQTNNLISDTTFDATEQSEEISVHSVAGINRSETQISSPEKLQIVQNLNSTYSASESSDSHVELPTPAIEVNITKNESLTIYPETEIVESFVSENNELNNEVSNEFEFCEDKEVEITENNALNSQNCGDLTEKNSTKSVTDIDINDVNKSSTTVPEIKGEEINSENRVDENIGNSIAVSELEHEVNNLELRTEEQEHFELVNSAVTTIETKETNDTTNENPVNIEEIIPVSVIQDKENNSKLEVSELPDTEIDPNQLKSVVDKDIQNSPKIIQNIASVGIELKPTEDLPNAQSPYSSNGVVETEISAQNQNSQSDEQIPDSSEVKDKELDLELEEKSQNTSSAEVFTAISEVNDNEVSFETSHSVTEISVYEDCTQGSSGRASPVHVEPIDVVSEKSQTVPEIETEHSSTETKPVGIETENTTVVICENKVLEASEVGELDALLNITSVCTQEEDIDKSNINLIYSSGGENSDSFDSNKDKSGLNTDSVDTRATSPEVISDNTPANKSSSAFIVLCSPKFGSQFTVNVNLADQPVHIATQGTNLCISPEKEIPSSESTKENSICGRKLFKNVSCDSSITSTEDCDENLELKKLKESLAEKLTQVSANIPQTDTTDSNMMTEAGEKYQQELSDLKLELNAAKQAKASLELEIGKKDEIYLKTQAEALKKEQQLQQEIKMLREELKEKSSLNEKDSIRDLEEALKEAKAKESQALVELNARVNDELNYRKIMEEYEKTIAARIADSHKLKEQNETVTRHLANLELSFSDLHQKYERTKAIVDGFKKNEEKMREKLHLFEDTIRKQEEKYESLKAHAKAQIEKSNKEILQHQEKYDTDLSKMKAIVKRLEIKCAALETSLDQKTNECIALAALCDEVTGKKV